MQTSAQSKEIILGVGAGIAAYKSCELLRRLQDRGYGITVVPTPSSLHFVGRATWEALSGRKVTTSVYEDVESVRHVSLADQATAVLIAPATADLIARIAHGRADDLLTNTVLATSAPIVLVPAMHPEMWLNQATQENLSILKARGIHIIEPDSGALTSGDSGIGRFPETARIITEFESAVKPSTELVGVKVLISAGGTREAIDPVRYIGNRSSGKQGIALAREALKRGAQVTMVAANIPTVHIPGLTLINVESAQEMLGALRNEISSSNVLFMSAAVADARPKITSDVKIKKSDLNAIELQGNPDIIAELSKSKKIDQTFVAFAAESSEDKVEARRKLRAKGSDLIYLNDISGGAIFGADSTQGWILDSEDLELYVPQTTKDTLARILLDQALIKLGYSNV